ncbi:MAG: thioredoxin family protein [Acidobacteria bacterium]|nr:thioredoxin family protein [Acidobacteriota bacterium]
MAHKLAYANPHITADAVDAQEFMDLSRRYRITGVPKTIVNDTVEILGGLPEADFVDAVLQRTDDAPHS